MLEIVRPIAGDLFNSGDSFIGVSCQPLHFPGAGQRLKRRLQR
jgi:hypothetical protein